MTQNQTEGESNEVETVSERETKAADPDLPPTSVIGVQGEPVDEKKDQEPLDGTEEEVVSGDLCKGDEIACGQFSCNNNKRSAV